MTTPPPGGIPQVVTDPLSVVAVETERHVAASSCSNASLTLRVA